MSQQHSGYPAGSGQPSQYATTGAGPGAGAGAGAHSQPVGSHAAEGAQHPAGRKGGKAKKKGFGSKIRGLFGFGKKKGKKAAGPAHAAYDPNAKFLPPLPEIALAMLERAMRHLDGCGALGIEGLYRVSGDAATVTALAQFLATGQFPGGPWASAATAPQPLALFHAHDIARAVARVLREHEPLCTYALSAQFMGSAASCTCVLHGFCAHWSWKH